eukprot:COSAG06_NODE_34416_length_474_cov_16.240000_2_plen_46_part_01
MVMGAPRCTLAVTYASQVMRYRDRLAFISGTTTICHSMRQRSRRRA